MHFTKLRLNGFKSFVDPTDLLIAPGLTGVVGPNGCGKSNLLEALRWVMGETRASAMRGDGMEDVIFAGAAGRPARNFAEVVLQIDNSERLAPAGFNDLDTLEVTRRITRDAGSAYKVSGKDVRARDVQMLFADASTGAHSPALVRQGVISELINARPKARRRILEEAAGISGLYQRRHEAELKLKGTETNLVRVEDVVEQLAVQLAQLARQARQAARYRQIGQALRQAEGMLLYRCWGEADEARLLADTALTDRTRVAAEAEGGARRASRHRTACEEKLPPLQEEEAIAAAVLQRLHVQRDSLTDQETRALRMVETLRARIEQLARDSQREADLNKDAGETIARLEWEQSQIAKASRGQEARLQEATDAASGAAHLLQTRESTLSQLTEDVARLAARHQSVHRLAQDSARTLTKNEAEVARACAAMAEAGHAVQAAKTGFEAAQADLQAANAGSDQAEAALIAADEARSQAQSREADARANHSEADGEASALRAEVAALARLVERDTAEGGQVMDLIRVEDGYEKALGAALADDLRAPVVGAGHASGWANLPGYPQGQTLPEGVDALTAHVTVPEVLARRMAQVGLVSPEDGARLQPALKPGQRLVNMAGDLWRWDGFRTTAQDAPSAAALRLQQLNRLVVLKRDLEEVSARAQGAAQAHDVLKRDLMRLGVADQAARDARRAADQTLTGASRALSRAEADQSLIEGRRESLAMAAARHQEAADTARQYLAEAQLALAGLGDLDAARQQVELAKQTVEVARGDMIAMRATHDTLKREGQTRVRRQQEIIKETSGWRLRLETADKRISELDERRVASEAELKDAVTAPEDIAAKRTELESAIDVAAARCHAVMDTLSLAQAALRDAMSGEREAERRASERRELRARADAHAEAARETVAATVARISQYMETTPEGLRAALDTPLNQMPADKMPTAEAMETDVNRLKRQRDALGAVNLRAEEDASLVAREHDSLSAEKQDLEEAIKTLRAGIASLNREGRERLLTAFEQVNSNFSMLFSHLFGGGEARLVLVESDDPLEAGLEIMCQPPGKKLSTLSLLSGGEQTLTALALIFAVFLANPAPICVLDEVDAPLDDANVTRFCDMLVEMTRRTDTRFLTITHHAVTMARMDRLFGVTMAELGVSQIVSVDLKKAESMVA